MDDVGMKMLQITPVEDKDMRRLSENRKYEHFAVVTPSRNRSFPIDMLRYDRCSPATERDSFAIERARGFDSTPEPVCLLRYSTSKEPGWCRSRWESFGWDLKVVEEPLRRPATV